MAGAMLKAYEPFPIVFFAALFILPLAYAAYTFGYFTGLSVVGASLVVAIVQTQLEPLALRERLSLEAVTMLVIIALTVSLVASYLKQEGERATRLARHDALTGLPNGKLFEGRFKVARAQMAQTGRKLGLMLLDLDGFNSVNDALGRDVGDQLLKYVALRLSKLVRKSDTVARLEGCKFLILGVDIGGAQDAARMAERILAAAKAPYRIGQREVSLTTSIGFAICPDDGEELEALILKARAAMEGIRGSGRDGLGLPSRSEEAARAYRRVPVQVT